MMIVICIALEGNSVYMQILCCCNDADFLAFAYITFVFD